MTLGRFELMCVSAVLRHTRVQKGRWRLHLRAMSLVHRHMPLDRKLVVRTKAGFRMRLDGSSQVGKVVYATGDYEPDIAAVFRSRLAPGATVLDVGAHIGYFTVLAAQAVGPRGTVISVEPQRRVRDELNRNIALNGLTNVEVHGVAAYDAAGERQLYLEKPDSTGQASLRAGDHGPTETIQAQTVDQLVRGRDISLVKIDAEGAERNILAGMRETLTRCRPELVIEVTDGFLRAFGHSADELHAYLGGFGYSAFEITDHGLEPIAPGHSWTEQQNVLFTCRPAEAMPRR